MDINKAKAFCNYSNSWFKKEMETYENNNLYSQEELKDVSLLWFMRLIAIRYMEVNKFLEDDFKIELASKSDIINKCNKLSKVIPSLFEIKDKKEIDLLPDNLFEENSPIKKIVQKIDDSYWDEIENVGWMYQYYIGSEQKKIRKKMDEKKKVNKKELATITQYFTPKWIVKYMVENSLGRLWLEGHPNEDLQSNWKYYLEEAEQEKEVEEELKKIREEHSKLTPEDIKVLDPCMGSGHILVYVFDVLYEIYKTAGYSEREIPKMILQNNLYGLDIDDRAAQLASFALIMKARHYNRRLFREIEKNHLELNLCSIQESNSINEEAIDYFCSLNTELDNESLRKDLEYLVQVFTDAKEYGSILEVEEVNFENLKQRLSEIENDNNLMFGDYRKILLDKLPIIIKQAEIMSRKYEVCLTNPPYMGNKGINLKLKNLIEKKYKDVRHDLFSVFIERCFKFSNDNSHLGFMTPFVWMFIKSYEKLRAKIINSKTISSLVQLEYSGFDGATVPICTFTLINKKVEKKGQYIRLSNFKGSENQGKKTLEAASDKSVDYRYSVSADQFYKIPGIPISYWVSNLVRNLFCDSKNLREIAEPKFGMRTGDNERFLRLWFEVDNYKCGYNLSSAEDVLKLNCKWVPFNKGGEFRKWYGNNEYMVNWKNNGEEIKENTKLVYPQLGDNLAWKITNEPLYFKKGLTWSRISSSNFGVRYSQKGFIFSDAGCCMFPEDENLYMCLAFLSSKITNELLKILSPTLTFQIVDISKLPIAFLNLPLLRTKVDLIVKDNIKISINDWDSFETSWDFKKHPLLLNSSHRLISDSFNSLENDWNNNFNKLKENEEELNRIFIDIYGLQDELTPEVEDKDITIRKADREREIRSFISYAVGCILGRYSIDSEGLIYAGGNFNDKWDFENNKVRKIEKDEDGNIISDSWVESRFMPDRDNIIPITEDEYFEDDIVSRFIDFVRTVYGEETLEENLDFIADSIGRKSSETSRQAIRRYFIKDFYKDHCKIYKHRPIYWEFNSGKNKAFKCLVYMHRMDGELLRNITKKCTFYLQDCLFCKKDEKPRFKKQFDELAEYLKELTQLDRKQIKIDLDDGVVYNYKLFEKVLSKRQ